ncbi:MULTISPECIES: hypothetical protein [unclassified Nonomuraea]|uniref:hypothetical protein n=1 Tax=unclassified Nonomuraea TaxID=2593643 RepID=UPI0035C1A986
MTATSRTQKAVLAATTAATPIRGAASGSRRMAMTRPAAAAERMTGSLTKAATARTT